jgi:hypothetical protein
MFGIVLRGYQTRLTTAGFSNLDFTMRHDWNSLLSEPSHSASGAYANGSMYDYLRVGCGGGAANPNVTCWTSATSASADKFTLDTATQGMRFTDYSAEYYPNADDLVRYFEHFAQHAGASGPANVGGGQLRIIYNARITRISGMGGASPLGAMAGGGAGTGPRFKLRAADGTMFLCHTLIMGTALAKAQVTMYGASCVRNDM